MPAAKHLSLSSTANELASSTSQLNQYIEQLAEEMHLSPGWVHRAQLVLEEAIVNIVSHAGVPAAGRIELEFTHAADAVAITIEDQGVAFDPFSDAPQATPEAGLAERQIGGLGIYLIKEMTQEYAYERRDQRNCLYLKLAIDV